MFVIRPIQEKDYPELLKIAEESGHGFTSLPVNEELISNKIKRAEASFKSQVSEQPEEHGFLFVMEEVATGKIMGTSGIESAVGLEDAFYHYHLGKVVHHSRELNIYNTADILTLCNDYTGATELCTLFLREEFRKGITGRVLSKFRFLFLAQHQERFSSTVIAEMRGVSDENGDSPFWQWLEKHFFSMDFPTADYLTGIGQKVFIAELMPKYPVYVNLLSEDAQAVIGKVHKNTEPALKLLKSEGFSYKNYVDIFDGGPTVEANIANIHTVQNSDLYTVEIVDALDSDKNIIISNTFVEEFRATVAKTKLDQEQKIITLTQEYADILKVKGGDQVRAAVLK
ncbi:arginine N-succinyltransferase [Psychrosphaera ytuae]|uniref:Arginine N-succinyltransferase n=1 Tax=Psychrosphaera ytuae TaxID=2820710 RepID=A0A975HJK4_9GAMM|nr:arginine N-succinyltransferase [Psychrosphaera ytuae]QTH65323.1 arginine N-succinyltransferase [Psychrosphaera ytuae]